jgi:hypothetical protein
MENSLVALSNFGCLWPLSLSFRERDYWTFLSIGFVSMASFVSHLIENHKHGMPGIGFSKKISYIWNRIDIAGCGIIITRLIQLYVSKYGVTVYPLYNQKNILMYPIIGFICMCISEYDKFNPALKTRYIFFHCLWHGLIFHSMHQYLRIIIY